MLRCFFPPVVFSSAPYGPFCVWASTCYGIGHERVLPLFQSDLYVDLVSHVPGTDEIVAMSAT